RTWSSRYEKFKRRSARRRRVVLGLGERRPDLIDHFLVFLEHTAIDVVRGLAGLGDPLLLVTGELREGLHPCRGEPLALLAVLDANELAKLRSERTDARRAHRDRCDQREALLPEIDELLLALAHQCFESRVDRSFVLL